MEDLINPKVIAVSEDTPVLKCIQLMRERNVGSLVILQRQSPQSLAGILTERDVIKQFEAISRNRNMPVAQIMTTDVITLPLGQLHRAASMILDHGFRHIVFTYPSDNERKKMIGIASGRDFLREYVRGAGFRLSPYAKTVTDVLLISDSDDSRSLFKRMARGHPQSRFRIHSIPENPELALPKNSDAVFVDIDHVPTKQWVSLLRFLIAGNPKNNKKLHVFFNPFGLGRRTRLALDRICRSGAICLFEKPLDIPALLAVLRD